MLPLRDHLCLLFLCASFMRQIEKLQAIYQRYTFWSMHSISITCSDLYLTSRSTMRTDFCINPLERTGVRSRAKRDIKRNCSHKSGGQLGVCLQRVAQGAVTTPRPHPHPIHQPPELQTFGECFLINNSGDSAYPNLCALFFLTRIKYCKL